MNQRAAKALRRAARADERGEWYTTSTGHKKRLPGKATKSLWASLNHKQRGQWRSKMPATRAKLKRSTRRALGALLATGRVSFADARSVPRSH
jgi:hypothetical protein